MNKIWPDMSSDEDARLHKEMSQKKNKEDLKEFENFMNGIQDKMRKK